MNALPLRWLHRNLFAKPFDTALSIIVVPVLAWAVFAAVQWSMTDARWDVLFGGLRVLMMGIYPVDQIWRAWIAAAVLLAIFGAGLGLSVRPSRGALAVACTAAASTALAVSIGSGGSAAMLWASCVALAIGAWVVVYQCPALHRFAIAGLLFGIAVVFAVMAPPGLEVWGGLLLSVILTICVSILCLPLGILLAFGRRSRIGSLRILCTAYIETMRSVPLILVVYWIWIIVPLLSPEASIPSLLRGMLGYVVFFSAYVAEYVRSGLQAVPKGQAEAARSLGMSNWTVNVDIVLPQALRVVVPALVGQILDIFNGATLVFIIGLTDFLRAGQMILADPQNSGRTYEVYVFLFAVYLTIGSAITYASRRLEAHLARGSR